EIEAQGQREFARDDFLETARQETLAKHLSRAELRSQLERLRATWPALRARLQAQLIPHSELKQRLQAVGAPTEPEAIGISRARLRRTFVRAQFIRRRFTVLDLALRTGVLDTCID